MAAPRLRTIRKKAWESKRNILAEVTPLLVSHLGIILGDSTLSEKNLWAMLATFNLEWKRLKRGFLLKLLSKSDVEMEPCVLAHWVIVFSALFACATLKTNKQTKPSSFGEEGCSLQLGWWYRA